MALSLHTQCMTLIVEGIVHTQVTIRCNLIIITSMERIHTSDKMQSHSRLYTLDCTQPTLDNSMAHAEQQTYMILVCEVDSLW